MFARPKEPETIQPSRRAGTVGAANVVPAVVVRPGSGNRSSSSPLSYTTRRDPMAVSPVRYGITTRTATLPLRMRYPRVTRAGPTFCAMPALLAAERPHHDEGGRH